LPGLSLAVQRMESVTAKVELTLLMAD